MNKEINDLRSKIDAIDDNIMELYKSRMSLVSEIGELKATGGISVVNGVREQQILDRLLPNIDASMQPYAKRMLTCLFDTSKAYQRGLQKTTSSIKDMVDQCIIGDKMLFPQTGSVACQGTEGSFSSLAARKVFDVAHATYFTDFKGVFNAVDKGLTEYGVLPIENSLAGSVNKVYDLMREYKFYIVRSIKLRVSHCLLANKGVKLKDIKEIYSHEQAINQSSEYLGKLNGVKIIACDNTATAARMVAESNRSDIAAISSEECAALYGLETLGNNIQNAANNYTRFILISKQLKIYNGADKISVMVKLPHESGSLNNLLTKFTMLGLNLTKIESRPMPNAEFEFMFYFDFNGDIADIRLRNLLAELDKRSRDFVFLGSYQEI